MPKDPKQTTKPPSSGQRVAAYIASVGEGNIFTKAQLTEAVPHVSQADRRMRDLREIGWTIDNYKMNPALKPDQYLLVKIGVRIDLGEKRPARARGTISGPQRARIFQRDGYTCQVCGIGKGEQFDDAKTQTARLTIGHIIPVARDGGTEDSNLRTECQRCNEQVRHIQMDPPDVKTVLHHASEVGGRKAKTELFNLMQYGRRFDSEVDRVYRLFQMLPRTQQLEIIAEFSKQVVTD